MNLGINKIKDLTPIFSGNAAVMLMSQIGGATAGSDSFMSVLGGMGASSVVQDQQAYFGGFQTNQTGQTDLNSAQPVPGRQVDQPTTTLRSDNQTDDKQPVQSASNQTVRQPAPSQNTPANSPANNQTPATTAGTGPQSNNVNTIQQSGATNSVVDKGNIKDQTAAAQTDSTNTLGRQVVTMADLLKTLNLSNDQTAQIAAALNTTPDQLGKIQVVIGYNAQSNFAVSIDATKLINKVAEVLNLNKAQTNSLFTALNVSSVDVKSGPTPVAGNIDTVSPLQITTANPALVAQVTAGEVKQIVQPDVGGNNFSFNSPSGSNTTATTQQTNPVSVTNGFNAVLNAASANGGATVAGNQPQAVSAVATAQEHANSAIMGQIIEKASILSLPNATETRMSLSPEKLGTVDIKLTMSDSSVNASIVVGSDAVKQVVEKNMDQLKLALNQQGIMVGQMNVSVGRQGNQPFGNGGLNGQNANVGARSVGGDFVAPVDLSAVNQTSAYGKTGHVLVNLTA